MRKKEHSRGPAASAMEPVVSEVGAGQDARKVILADGWELTAWTGRGETEPRIRDLDLAKRLGYANPFKIRDLIRTMIARKNLSDVEVFPSPGKTYGGRPGKEYWLTEAQALKVAARSETEPADAILDEMIHVFQLARRGLLPGQRPGLTEDDLHRVAFAVLGEAMVPIVRELAELKRALAERPDGIISTHQAQELKRQIGVVARDLIDLGDHETLKAAKAALNQQVMAASGWGGTGRARYAMPASRYAEALAALRALQQQAERRLRRARRPKAQPKRGQLHLGLN